VRKLFSILIGFLAATCANASPSIDVLVVYTSRAASFVASYSTGTVTMSGRINAQMDVWNETLYNSAPSHDLGTVNLVAAVQLTNTTIERDVISNALADVRGNMEIAALRDYYHADYVIFVDTAGDSSDASYKGGRAPICAKTPLDAIAVVNARVLLNNAYGNANTFAHEGGHGACARHWDDPVGNAAGYFYRDGNWRSQTCINDAMSYNTDDYIRKNCSGWASSGYHPGAANFFCDFQDWCDEVAVDITNANGSSYQPPTVGAVSGSLPAPNCAGKGTRRTSPFSLDTLVTYTNVYPTGPYDATPIPCGLGVTSATVYSNPNVNFPGTAIPAGTSNQNNAGAVGPGMVTLSGLHNFSLVSQLRALFWATSAGRHPY
jgi:hypothetical protein